MLETKRLHHESGSMGCNRDVATTIGQGREIDPFLFIAGRIFLFVHLFHMYCLAVWIERTADPHLLAFVLFYQILAIDIICGTARVL